MNKPTYVAVGLEVDDAGERWNDSAPPEVKWLYTTAPGPELNTIMHDPLGHERRELADPGMSVQSAVLHQTWESNGYIWDIYKI